MWPVPPMTTMRMATMLFASNGVAPGHGFWSAAGMDPQAVLGAFDEQIRRQLDSDAGGRVIERDPRWVRSVSPDGWAGVTWSHLDEASADAVLKAQVTRFAGARQPWEWKYYSYDEPSDLPDRLLAAGFVPEEPEALLVAEISELPLGVVLPEGLDLVPVNDDKGIEALISVHEEVFGGDHAGIGRALRSGIGADPPTTTAVVAMAGSLPVSSGRIEFHHGTDFASIWGGGTLPAYRGRGLFRALVAHRAAEATRLGFRYLQVDASSDSRPILRRLGFVELATTIPFTHPGRAD